MGFLYKNLHLGKILNMLKVAVLGAGHLGRIHLKLLQGLKEYDLVGFYDPNKDVAEKVSKEFKLPSYDSIDELIDMVDVVDIVTPTLSHYDCAVKALNKSKHVFIEKPVTNSIEEAELLEQLASQVRVKVQVGHVERFNPAFVVAKPFVKDPLFIETHRLAPFNPRGTDVSVVLDLMIHDIDIVLNLVDSELIAISTSGVAVASDSPDITNARLEFANGCVANLTASRVSLKSMRKTRIFQKDAYISIDFLDKKTEVLRLTDANKWNPLAMNIEVDTAGNKKQIHIDKPKVKDTNAIQEELRTFALAIQNNTKPLVTLEEGCEALKVAHTIVEKINERIAKSLHDV